MLISFVFGSWVCEKLSTGLLQVANCMQAWRKLLHQLAASLHISSCSKSDVHRLDAIWRGQIGLIQLVGKFHETGKIHNVHQVCGAFGCVVCPRMRNWLIHMSIVFISRIDWLSDISHLLFLEVLPRKFLRFDVITLRKSGLHLLSISQPSR